jgi:hypothetical protein
MDALSVSSSAFPPFPSPKRIGFGDLVFICCYFDAGDLGKSKACHTGKGEFINLHVPPISLSKSNCICECYFDAIDLVNHMGIRFCDLQTFCILQIHYPL